jgi:hypothetical protein
VVACNLLAVFYELSLPKPGLCYVARLACRDTIGADIPQLVIDAVNAVAHKSCLMTAEEPLRRRVSAVEAGEVDERSELLFSKLE